MNEKLLKAAKYMQRELWMLSLTPIRDLVAIDDERTLEALDAVGKAYIVLSEAIEEIDGKAE